MKHPTYTCTISSLNTLEKRIKNGEEKRNRINIAGTKSHPYTGLMSQIKSSKKNGKSLLLVRAYKIKGTNKLRYEHICVWSGDLTELKERWMMSLGPDGAEQTNEMVVSGDKPAGGGGSKGPKLSAVIEDWYLRELKLRRKATQGYMVRYLDILKDTLGHIRVSKISGRDIELLLESIKEDTREFAAHRPSFNVYTGNATRNQALTTYNMIFGWCIELHLIKKHPCGHIGLLEVNDDTEVELSRQHLHKYLKFLHTNDKFCNMQRSILLVLMYTGLRKGEVLHMKVGDLKFHNHPSDDYRWTATYTIPQWISKTKKTISMPFSATVTRIILEMMEFTGYRQPDDLIFPAEKQMHSRKSPTGGKYAKNIGMRNRVIYPSKMNEVQIRICDKYAKIPRFRIHGTRHIFTTYISKLRVDEFTQRRLTSHSAAIGDVHAKVYNHDDYKAAMVEATARLSTFYNYIADPREDSLLLNGTDFENSFDFWVSTVGQRITQQFQIKFGSIYELTYVGRLEALQNNMLDDITAVISEYGMDKIAMVSRGG